MELRLCILSACFVLSACGSDGGGSGANSGESCAQIRSKLESCGLLEGAGGELPGCTEHPTMECQNLCVARGSCAELEAGVCSGPLEEFLLGGAIGDCQDACEGDRRMPCADGTDVIDGAGRCDGFEECDDGADELNCPMFACSDGSEVVESARCDSFDDCPDGSDEDGCSIFRCADSGQTTLPHHRCDGVMQCSDGSDEQGCPQFVCQ